MRQYNFNGYVHIYIFKNIGLSLYFKISDRHFKIIYVTLTTSAYTYFQGDSLVGPTG